MLNHSDTLRPSNVQWWRMFGFVQGEGWVWQLVRKTDMRNVLYLVVVALFIVEANGNFADVKEGGCVWKGINSQSEPCEQLLNNFFGTQLPGYSYFAGISDGDCCYHHKRSSCEEIGSILRLDAEQTVDPACLTSFGVTKSSGQRNHTVNISLLIAFFITVTYTLL